MKNKTKLKEPEEIIKIFDNPKYIDRYEFIIDSNDDWEYNALSCSSNPDSPQGVSQFCKDHIGVKLEKSIDWNEVPENVQKHVINRLK